MSTVMATLTTDEFNQTCKLLGSFDPNKYNLMQLSWSDKGYKISQVTQSDTAVGHIFSNIFSGWGADITLTNAHFERSALTQFFISNKEEALKHPEILAKFREFLSQNEMDYQKLIQAGLYSPPTPRPGEDKIKTE